MNTFESNVIKTWGEKGRIWLSSLPSLIDTLAKYWNLSDLKPVSNLSFNYVMIGEQGPHKIILKIGCDENDIKNECIALKTYNGHGAVQLLASNLNYNALLLERLLPGNSLVSFYPQHDDDALRYAVEIMRKLHSAPISPQLPLLQTWFKDLYEPHSALSSYHIQKAQDIAHYLFTTSNTLVMLHGDLHHDNILLSDHGWVGIDPKGVIGDPAFEVCSFIRNPFPEQVKSKEVITHRLRLFSEHLSIDIKRLYQWIYIWSVLEACWMMKDGITDVKKALEEAEQIDQIKV